MRVVVTGGAGYIGSIAVERLLARGDDVTVLDNLWRGHPEAVARAARFISLDLRNAAAVEEAIASSRPEAVLHFAAATLVPESVSLPALYFSVNVGGTINLLNALAAAGVTKFVFSSTAAVYGEPEFVPISEENRTVPINPYGRSKLVVEQLLPAYEAAYALAHVSFRYFNVAGATPERGEDHRPETHVVPVILQTLLGQRSNFKLFGTDYDTPDGTAVRDYVHVVDLVDAHLLALDKLERPLGTFNLGTRTGFSVAQIVDAAERITGRKLQVEHHPRRAGDPPSLIADSTRARDELAWDPGRSTLEEMIGSAWEWMQRHPAGYENAT